MIQRRAGQPRQLKQTSHAVVDMLGVLVPRVPEAPPPPASLVAILVAGHVPYVGPLVSALRDWQQFATPGQAGPARPNSSTPLRRGLRRTPEAHSVSAPMTRQAS